MKIAIASHNKEDVATNFARADWYLVFTVKEGKIKTREIRRKPEYRGSEQGKRKDWQKAKSLGWRDVFLPIADCDVVIARNMRKKAYEGIRMVGIQPVIMDIQNAEEAVGAYLVYRTTRNPLSSSATPKVHTTVAPVGRSAR